MDSLYSDSYCCKMEGKIEKSTDTCNAQNSQHGKPAMVCIFLAFFTEIYFFFWIFLFWILNFLEAADSSRFSLEPDSDCLDGRHGCVIRWLYRAQLISIWLQFWTTSGSRTYYYRNYYTQKYYTITAVEQNGKILNLLRKTGTDQFQLLCTSTKILYSTFFCISTRPVRPVYFDPCTSTVFLNLDL